jgi:F-type H+-transporting ATPase subunit b
MSLLSVSTTSTFSEGNAVNVDLDASLLVQVGLFVFLLIILKPLLFDPMLKLFAERESKIDKVRRDAVKVDRESAKAAAKYEQLMAKARDGANAERDALRAEGTKKEAETMARVRALSATTIEQGRASIAQEAKAARASLASEAATLGAAIASRVLGREVSS